MPAQKKKTTTTSGLTHHVQNISKLMVEKKAIDVIIIDVHKITTLTDFFVICTSESDPQTRAITNHIDKHMKDNGMKAWHIEGYANLEWVLLDYIDTIVHVFKTQERDYYNIEKLWDDAPKKKYSY